MGEIAGRDVGVFCDLRDLRDLSRVAHHESHANARGDQLGEGTHVQRAFRRKGEDRRLLGSSIPQHPIRGVFKNEEVIPPREFRDLLSLALVSRSLPRDSESRR